MSRVQEVRLSLPRKGETPTPVGTRLRSYSVERVVPTNGDGVPSGTILELRVSITHISPRSRLRVRIDYLERPCPSYSG